MWSNKYIGIPYKQKGRDLDGIDCWGLVRLVYEQEYNIILPSFSAEYIQQDVERIQDLISQYKEGWEQIDQPVEGCVVVFKVLGADSHIGVAVSSTHFLHAREGQESAIESFSSPRWNKRILGYFKYVENNQLMTAVPHPLRTERFTLPITPGTTVLELVGNINQKYSIQPELSSKVIVMVAGRPIPQSEWGCTTIQAGDSVEYRAVAGGGGGGFRMFAMLAIAIAAPYIANVALGGAWGVSAMAAAGTAGLATASTLTLVATTMAVSMVGSMLINAIAPIRPPAEPNDPGSSERQLMVTGSANRANPYSAIPVILGKVKLTPPLGANNFISYQNERDTYLTMLLVWGYGPLQIDASTLKIGDVPISNYTLDTFSDGSQKLITLDRKTEPTSTIQTKFDSIYGSDVAQDTTSLELTCEGNPEDPNVTPGPFKTIAYTQPVNKVIVALHFPQGIRKIRVKGDGAGDSTTTGVKIRYEVSVNNGPWTVWKTVTYGLDGVKKDAFTVTETYDVTNQPVSIRIRRESGDNTEDNPDDRYNHTVVYQAATFFNTNTKPTRDPKNCKIAKTALQIKASEQLNNQIEGINAIVQTWCLSWNGTTWEYAATNNPADLFRYILQHPGNPQRVLDSEISTKLNLSEIQRWHDYCETMGFTYNSVLASQRSVLDTIRDICAAGRASPAMIDGKWSVVIDEPKPIIVQHFTPHNSWGFESAKALPRLPDALKITFYDEDQDYQEVESIVYNIGKNIDNAELFESINLPGVTKASLVLDHAKWHMAQAILRKEVYTINTDIEYIVCNRGDRVKVTHDVPMWGLGSGRVKNRLVGSTTFELDEPVTMQESKSYTIRFRSSTGTSTDFTVFKQFALESANRVNNLVTMYIPQTYHPIQVGDVLSITSSNTSLNTTAATVTEVGQGYFKYILAGSNLTLNIGELTGTAKLKDDTYNIIGITANSTTDQVNSGDLFLFGEFEQEAQDLIITNIEPTSNKSARITMVDYGITDTYNIFTDYTSLTEATVFETQVSQPARGLINSFKTEDKPTITYIQSDDLVSELISPGTYAYKIKVSYSNVTTPPNTVSSVECQYTYSSTTKSSGYKSILVEYFSNTIEIPNVIAGEEYKVRLRYRASDGRAGLWTDWTNHTVLGKTVNYNTVTSISVRRSKKSLIVTPFSSTIPDDFKYFEIKIFKDSGAGDFWASTDTNIKTYTSVGTLTVNLSDFASPRISQAGTKYRIACRMLDNSGNYSTTSTLTSILLYDISP